MRKYYSFSEEYIFRKAARRYNISEHKLMQLIVAYVNNRHDEHFTICLSAYVGVLEPFLKNEIKPTIQELCRLFDAHPFTIELDERSRIRLYVI